MASRYWVGASADWDGTAGTKWATTSGGAGGAAVPTISDDVFFDANSGGGTDCEKTTNTDVASLNFTGFTGIFRGAGTIDAIGSLTLGSGMTYSHTGSLQFTSDGSITSNGITITSNQIEINSGAVITLQDSLVHTGTNGIILTNGTLNANNFNVTCFLFNGSNSNVRTLTMGSGTWTITGSGTVWTIATTTNLTLNANTSTIKLTDNSASNKIFSAGSLTYNNYWNATQGAGVCIMQGGNSTWNDFKIDAGRNQQFNAGSTFTISSLTAIGTSIDTIIITSSSAATHTLSDASGINTVEHCSISYSIASGGATFNAENSTDGGNNTGWNFINTAVKTVNGLAQASVKTIDALAIASVKSINGLE